MTKDEFDDFKKHRYDVAVLYYDDHAKWNHNAYQWSQWVVIVLSAITPVLVAVATGWLKWATVAIAVVLAVASGALRAFKYQENWLNYRTTCETLKKEQHYLAAGIQGYERVEDRQALFVERVENLISRENTLWVITHQKEDSKNKKSDK